jgi:hypothetical protein
MIIRVTLAKYFARSIFKSEMGRVNRSSIVPVLLSSAIDLMVIAGIRIKKIRGVALKKGIKSASAPCNRFASIDAIQCIIPEVIKKISMKTYPITELKKLLISLKYSALIDV